MFDNFMISLRDMKSFTLKSFMEFDLGKHRVKLTLKNFKSKEFSNYD